MKERANAMWEHIYRKRGGMWLMFPGCLPGRLLEGAEGE